VAATRSWPKRIARGVLFAVVGFVVASVGCVLTLRWVDPWTSSFILRDRYIAWKNDDKQFAYRREWVDLNRISPAMQLAVIASEDQKFPMHHGFDFDQINTALDERESGKRVRGASTISQQVAKNLFLWPGQSWVRKGIEAYFTVLIESLWPKRRILEMYLNLAEFGHGVYGVQAAAHTFLNKSASHLSFYDAALFAAVLPSPKRLHANAPSIYLRARQRWIAAQMQRLGGPAYLSSIR